MNLTKKSGIILVVLLIIFNLTSIYFVETSSSELAETPSPSFQNDENNSGYSDINTSSVKGEVRWVYRSGGEIHSSPAIGSDGTIYFGSKDQSLHAVKPNGKYRWTFDTKWTIDSSPAIDENGSIYFGSDDNNFYSISSDGQWNWKHTTKWDVSSSPVIGDKGRIYFVSSSGKLFAFTNSGEQKWGYNLGSWEKTDAGPAIGPDGTIYVGYNNGMLYAINRDGTLKWKYDTPGPINSPPSINQHGDIFFTSDKLYSLSPDGEELWNYSANGTLSSTAALHPEGRVYVGDDNGELHTLSFEGDLLWTYQTEGAIKNSPAVTKDMIFVGSDKLYALEENGSLSWTYVTDSRISSSPSISGSGTVYVGCKDGKLYALGKQIEKTLPSAPTNLEANVGDGKVNITWREPFQDGNTNITSYNIYRISGSREEKLLASVDADKTYYVDETVQNGKRYEFYIKAINEKGESDPSKRIEVKPVEINDNSISDFFRLSNPVLYPTILLIVLIISTGGFLTKKRARSIESKEIEEREDENSVGHAVTLTCPNCGFHSRVEMDDEDHIECPRCSNPMPKPKD